MLCGNARDLLQKQLDELKANQGVNSVTVARLAVQTLDSFNRVDRAIAGITGTVSSVMDMTQTILVDRADAYDWDDEAREARQNYLTEAGGPELRPWHRQCLLSRISQINAEGIEPPEAD